MRKRPVLCALTCAVLLIVPAAFAAAQYDIGDAAADLEQVAAALSGIFGPNLGGMSYVGEPIGYSLVPRVALGVSGGIVFVPLENIDTGTSLDVEFAEAGGLAALPIPAVGAHAKFTILKKFEAGIKVAGIPEIKNDKAGVAVDNLIIGGKVRYGLLKFRLPVVRGGVSVGALYEHMRGGILLTQSDTTDVQVAPGGPPEGTLTTTADLNTEWRSNTFGGEAQANLQVLFLNFFAGTRVSKTFGKATTSLNGRADLTGPGVDDGWELISINRESKPSGLDPYVFGGAEVKLLGLVLAGKGTYNLKNDNYILEAGLRLQF